MMDHRAETLLCNSTSNQLLWLFNHLQTWLNVQPVSLDCLLILNTFALLQRATIDKKWQNLVYKFELVNKLLLSLIKKAVRSKMVIAVVGTSSWKIKLIPWVYTSSDGGSR